MFGWLTRNDGPRVARAKRRLGSPRASVFTEFAIIAPILVLVCSALVEIVGFWDAQVMANHTAWTVGRVAMVRGSDGLEFSSGYSKFSKTGIECTSMPESLKKMLEPINSFLGGANRFNNRGNIATLFLMSTCGIGYFGKSPGTTISDGLKELVDAACDALVKGIPDWITGMATDLAEKLKLPDFLSGSGDSITKFVMQLLSDILDSIWKAVVTPIAEWLRDQIEAAAKEFLDWLNIDAWFDGPGAAARLSRQLFGAASRIARAKNRTGAEVLTVKDMDEMGGLFLFTKNNPAMGRLVYPQVVDSEAKSDGYFVTGVHGWPAEKNGLAMVHVQIDWPYESSWVFPVVSGFGSASKPPVATGHSMVFPQPAIKNQNLYSEGAEAYKPGDYTNTVPEKAFKELAEEMNAYLRCAQFGMKYRICDETLTLMDSDKDNPLTTYKYVDELSKLWPFDVHKSDSYPRRGDYEKCWNLITGNKSQHNPMWYLEDHFKPSLYHNFDYFYWDGALHTSYRSDLVGALGKTALPTMYEGYVERTYKTTTANAFRLSEDDAKKLFGKYEKRLKEKFPKEKDLSHTWLKDKLDSFASRNRVNVSNLCKWQTPGAHSFWVQRDTDVHYLAVTTEVMGVSFENLRNFVRREIKEIDEILDGTGQYTGDADDPVYDPEDQSMLQDPEAAEKRARDKWNKLKGELREKLRELDAAVVKLRDEWKSYKAEAGDFVKMRAECLTSRFADACVNLILISGDVHALDERHESVFFSYFPKANYMHYYIAKQTDVMYSRLSAYHDALQTALEKELEYGTMLGLESAKRPKKEGKSLDDLDWGNGEDLPADNPGTLSPGSDDAEIIKHDHMRYEGGKWRWR